MKAVGKVRPKSHTKLGDLLIDSNFQSSILAQSLINIHSRADQIHHPMKEGKQENTLENLRNAILNLMEERFGFYTETNNRIKFNNYTNAAIAEVLGYSESTITRLLKNPDLKEKQPLKETALQNIIIDLVMFKQNKEFTAQIATRQEQFENKKAEVLKLEKESRGQVESLARLQRTGRMWKIFAIISSIGGFVLIAVLFFNRSDSDVYVVRNKEKMVNIMEWHGKRIIHNLVWEAILINHKAKQNSNKIDRGYIELELEDTKKIIMNTVYEGRNFLRDINFQTPRKENLADLIKRTLPDSVMEKVLRDTVVINTLFNTDDSFTFRDVQSKIHDYIYEVQQDNWDSMWVKGWLEDFPEAKNLNH